eukprot:511064_1
MSADFSSYKKANKWTASYCAALDRFWNRSKWDINDEYFQFYADDIQMYWNGKLVANSKQDLFNRWTSFRDIHKTFNSEYQLTPRFDKQFIEFELSFHYFWFDGTESTSIENCANYFDDNGKIKQQHWFATLDFRQKQDIMHQKYVQRQNKIQSKL